MKQPTKRFLSILLGFVFLSGAFAVYFYFSKPLYEDTNKVRAQLYADRDFMVGQKETIDKIGELIGSYDQPEQVRMREQVSAALPREIDFSGMLAQINGIAQLNNMRATSIGFRVTGNQSRAIVASAKSGASSTMAVVRPLGTVAVSIAIDGDYADLRAFIETIETNLRIFEATGISIKTGQDKKTGEVGYSHKLGFVAYYQLP